MLSYPVRLVPTRGGRVRATFPDLPQACTEGEDEADALFRAGFMLDMCLAHLAAHGQRPPPPSDICGGPMVTTRKFRGAAPVLPEA
jgi:antitoxin HicB